MTDGWKFIGEWTILDCPEYVSELGEYRRGEDQMVFMHIKFRKWNKSVFKKAISDFKLFREFVTCPLYACAEVDDKKFEKWVGRVGFQYLSTALCTDGKQRRVFINFKDGNKNEFKQTTNTVVPTVVVCPVGRTGSVPLPSVSECVGCVPESSGRASSD